MKKLTMICMSALLMLAVSCKKDKVDEIENAGSGFRATVEQQSDDSKTHLDGLAVKWNSGDEILVKSSTCTALKRFTTTGANVSANFDAAESLPVDFYTPDYTAYYPSAMFSGSQITLPATQTYEENTFANGANPMAATSSTNVLPFKNVCGVLELQLYSEEACQVSSITLTTNGKNELLYGTGTVTLTDGIPTLGTLSDGGTTLTLNCGGISLSTNESQPTDFYFVVPAGTLGQSFTVIMTTTDGNMWSKTATATQNLIVRSQITVMPKLPATPCAALVTTKAGCVGCLYTFSGNVTMNGTHECEYGFVCAKSADNTDPTIGGTGCKKFIVNTETLSGSKDFTADLWTIELEEDVEYTVKAYGICDEEVAYGAKQTYVHSLPKPLPSTWTNGKNPHPFTVGMDGETPRIVYFSQANLQYNAEGNLGSVELGGNVGGIWRFAEHQFDFLGTENVIDYANISKPSMGWIDLFGWGTSGYNHGALRYQPWIKDYDYQSYYAYGNEILPLEGGPEPHTGMADWGKANTISNGGTNSWRTLTFDEWKYLIITRGGGQLYGEGMIGSCTRGLIILPDDWTLPSGLTFTPGAFDWANKYTFSQWARMEAAGAVFLPASGRRLSSGVDRVGTSGFYWSSSCRIKNYAYTCNFNGKRIFSETPYQEIEYNRSTGQSVRLVSGN